jgi:hypothetical protein
MAEIVIGIIGTIVGVCGLMFSFITLSRNKKNDDRDEGKEDGVVLTELGYIKKGIDGIEHKIEKQETQYLDVIKHLTEVEASTKQAHKRIDALEEYHRPH